MKNEQDNNIIDRIGGENMKPNSDDPMLQMILDKLDVLVSSVSELSKKIKSIDDEQSSFILKYTETNSELKAEIRRINENTERAHQRIDSITKITWALMSPLLIALIISSIGFLWAILNHTVVITMP